MPDLRDFGGLSGLGGAAGGLGALASLAGSGGGGGGRRGSHNAGHNHGGGGGMGGLGGLGAVGLLAGMAAAGGGGGGRGGHNYNNHCGRGGYHHGHGGHGGFGGAGGFGHHGVGGGYGFGPGGFGVGMGGVGYGMGGMGRYAGYSGGHHGYRGSAMRLPWMGVLAATAVAGGAAAVYPRGARSQVTWKEGSKQVSAQIGGLTVHVPRAQNLTSVSTISTQDPYVKAKLLVDGYQVSEVRSGTHNNGGRNPDWTGKSSFFTFYVPSNVSLSRLAVVLEVYDANTVSSDTMIGTCGKIPLHGIADGKMRWWTVTSGGQLQASVYSDVQFSGNSGGGFGQQPQKIKDKSKKKKKDKHKKSKHGYSGGGESEAGLRNRYNGYVNGMNNAGRNLEVLPFEVWARGRYRGRSDSSSSSSGSSSSSSSSDSDVNAYRRDNGERRKHGYGDRVENTGYAVPAGGNLRYDAPAATAPPVGYTFGGAGGAADNFQSPEYRPPPTVPSAPPAYPGAYPEAPPAYPGGAYPEAPPPYPG